MPDQIHFTADEKAILLELLLILSVIDEREATEAA